MDKPALRKAMAANLRALPPAQRALEEEMLAAGVQTLPEWAAARTVLLYRAVAPEITMVGLTLAAWRAGKRTVFPRVGIDGAMTLHQVGAWTEFQEGFRGIPEPVASAPEVQAADVDLAIIPGVAFDKTGHRLGRGGGHFDRLLPRLRCPVWGAAFDVQVVDALPVKPHDAVVARVLHMAAWT